MPRPTKHMGRALRGDRYASAWIFLNGGADSECQVLDVSLHGAKLVAREPSEVPARFELAFLQNGQKRRICEVMWRRGKMLGIKFVIEALPSLADPANPFSDSR